MNWINKIAGIVAGIFKAALFVSVILLVFDAIDERNRIIPEKVQGKSLLYEPMSELVPTLLPFLKLEDLRRAGKEEDELLNQS
jgi:membrane protein required for colicin V production